MYYSVNHSSESKWRHYRAQKLHSEPNSDPSNIEHLLTNCLWFMYDEEYKVNKMGSHPSAA